MRSTLVVVLALALACDKSEAKRDPATKATAAEPPKSAPAAPAPPDKGTTAAPDKGTAAAPAKSAPAATAPPDKSKFVKYPNDSVETDVVPLGKAHLAAVLPEDRNRGVGVLRAVLPDGLTVEMVRFELAECGPDIVELVPRGDGAVLFRFGESATMACIEGGFDDRIECVELKWDETAGKPVVAQRSKRVALANELPAWCATSEGAEASSAPGGGAYVSLDALAKAEIAVPPGTRVERRDDSLVVGDVVIARHASTAPPTLEKAKQLLEGELARRVKAGTTTQFELSRAETVGDGWILAYIEYYDGSPPDRAVEVVKPALGLTCSGGGIEPGVIDHVSAVCLSLRAKSP